MAVFALLAIISLLDMIGWVTIREASQRKWLFRFLIGSIVPAVAGLGTLAIRELGTQMPSTVVPTADAKAKSEVRESPVGNISAGVATPATPPQPPDPVEASAPVSEPTRATEDAGLVTWGARHLGPRPEMPAEFEGDYPPCVAELQARRRTDIGLGDAAECRRQLEAHHQRWLVPLYTQRSNYGRAILNQQESLLRGGLTAREVVLVNFTRREDENFNHPQGQALRQFQAADERIRRDMDRCRTSRCKGTG